MSKRLQQFRGKDEEGFTLVELLVVIVILGILAAVVVFAVGGINNKGEKSACKIDTRTLVTAEEAFLASPSSGGFYTTEALLKGQFISEESSLHDISLAADKKSFVITVVNPQCGTVTNPATAVNGTSHL